MKVANNILELIGNTPMVRLNNLTTGLKPTILAKMESLNPGGSVKDRIGVEIIEAAEKEGVLKPGGTIVEATSGNTGVGLALVAAVKGYKTVFVMPDKMSMEKVRLLKAYGAKVVITPTTVPRDSPESYYSVAERIARETPNSFYANQYFNHRNPQAHYKTTGPEIWTQTNGKIDVLVAGVGTGGTITGIAKYLKEKNPKIKIIGVDPEGSVFHHHVKGEKWEIHTYKVEGIGEDFLPGTVDLSLIDEFILVSDKESFLMARRLAKEEGIFVGGSSGAAVHATLKIAKDYGKDKTMVVILRDSGYRYISKFFSDEWMEANGFLDEKCAACEDKETCPTRVK